MTLSTLTSRISYPGPGSGPFTFPFRILAAADLRVTKRSSAGAETTLALGTDYSVAGVLNASGSVTLTLALVSGELLVIRRAPGLTQPASIRNQGPLFQQTLEDECDRLVMQLQSLKDEIDRCFKLSETLSAASYDVVLPSPEAGKVVTGTGTGFTMSTLDSSAVSLPGAGRTVPTLSAYLANNAYVNVLDYDHATHRVLLDGSNDDTVGTKLAISSLPSTGGLVFIRKPGGVAKLRLTSHLSTEINSKECVFFVGDNRSSFRGNNTPGPPVSVVYLKDLTTYMTTKSGTTNDVLGFEGIQFDGANGGGWAGAGATCPGVVNSNGLIQYHFTLRRVCCTNFAYAHTNVAGSRAVMDVKPVFGDIDECEFSYTMNGRLLMLEGGTHTMIRRTEFTGARECVYLRTFDSAVFDHCVFESCTFAIASYLSQVVMRSPWFENIGFNGGTAFTTGIAQRNHGLTFGAGALVANTGIVCPISQLYGSLKIEDARIQTLASGGSNYTAPAWIEALGQATATSQGGSLYVSGKKSAQAGPQALFNTTMAFAATERGVAFHVAAEDTHSTESGSFGASLFVGTGIPDARKCNRGFGRITMDDASVYIFSFHGGKLWHDIHDFTSQIALPPSVPGIAATKYPAGGQWEVGDRIFFQPQASAFTLGVECVTAGTSAPVWGLIDQVMAPGANKGDANSVLASFAEPTIVIYATALGANRTVTLPAPASSFPRQRFRIVRTGLGAFTLTVQTSAAAALKVMPAGTAAFVDVAFSVSANEWILVGYGVL